MRKLVLAVVGVLVIALAVDFGAAITSEYRVSRAIRHSADLGDDPEVSIGGFPFLAEVGTGHIDHMSVRAREVPSRTVGRLVVEAWLDDVELPTRSMTLDPDETVTIGRIHADLVIGQTYLGQMLGIPDLEMSAPSTDPADGTGGTGGAGQVAGPAISPQSVLLTGTVPVGQTEDGDTVSEKVAVLVLLVLNGDRVSIVPDQVHPVPGSDGTITNLPDLAVAGAPFAASISVEDLPLGITPIGVHARGSELVISGVDEDVTVTVADLLLPGRPE